MPPEPDEGQQVVQEGQETTAPPAEPAASTEPAPWADILGVLPESLHSQVDPHLKKYHETLEQQRQEALTKYQPIDPYLEQYGDFTELEKRLKFAQNFENDPLAVYNQIREWAIQEGLLEEEEVEETPPAGQEAPPEEIDEGDVPPWLKAQLEAQSQSIASLQKMIEEERKAKEETKLQSEFNAYLKSINEAHPGVPEDYLIAQIAAGKDGMQVAQAYLAGIQAKVQEALKPGEEAPPVLSGGGSQPSTQVPGAITDREVRRQLVLAKLQQAAQQNT